MTPEEIWRTKSDEELIAASMRLDEYTAAGQRIILAELQRRRDSGVLSGTRIDDYASAVNHSNGTADETSDTRHGFIARLWRGEVSLPITYWVWGVAGNIGWKFVIALALATDMGMLALLFALLYIVYLVLIFVAIWRSAGRYRGNRIWADLALISLALGLITTVAGLFVS